MNALLHFLRVAVGLDEQSSQLTAAETELLLRHLEGAQVFVEIGCYEGKTSCAAARRGVRRVYSVDPFPSGRLAICDGEWIARIQRRRDKCQNLTAVSQVLRCVSTVFLDMHEWIRHSLSWAITGGSYANIVKIHQQRHKSEYATRAPA